MDPREGLVASRVHQGKADYKRLGSKWVKALGPQLIEGFHNPSSMRTILMGDDEDVYIYIHMYIYIHNTYVYIYMCVFFDLQVNNKWIISINRRS